MDDANLLLFFLFSKYYDVFLYYLRKVKKKEGEATLVVHPQTLVKSNLLTYTHNIFRNIRLFIGILPIEEIFIDWLLTIGGTYLKYLL